MRAGAVRRRAFRPPGAAAGRRARAPRGFLGAAGGRWVRRRPLSRAFPAGHPLDVRPGVSARPPAHPARRRGGAHGGGGRGGRRRAAGGQSAPRAGVEPVARGARPGRPRRVRHTGFLRPVLRARPGRPGSAPAARRPRAVERADAHLAVRRRRRRRPGAARRRRRGGGFPGDGNRLGEQLGQRAGQRRGARGSVPDAVRGRRPAGARRPYHGPRLGAAAIDAGRAGAARRRAAGGARRADAEPRGPAGERRAGRSSRAGLPRGGRSGAGGAGVPRAASGGSGCLDRPGDGRPAAGTGGGGGRAGAGRPGGGGGGGGLARRAAGRWRHRRAAGDGRDVRCARAPARGARRVLGTAAACVDDRARAGGDPCRASGPSRSPRDGVRSVVARRGGVGGDDRRRRCRADRRARSCHGRGVGGRPARRRRAAVSGRLGLPGRAGGGGRPIPGPAAAGGRAGAGYGAAGGPRVSGMRTRGGGARRERPLRRLRRRMGGSAGPALAGGQVPARAAHGRRRDGNGLSGA